MVQTALRGSDPGMFMGLITTFQFAQRDARDAGTEIRYLKTGGLLLVFKNLARLTGF
jgi:hypothetical protein